MKGKQHKLELFNSKLSDKKKLLFDGHTISEEKKQSDYKHSFNYEGLTFTVKQQSTEIFDVLINNISFDNLMNEERHGRLKPKRKVQPAQPTQPHQQYSSSTSSSYNRMKQDEELARYLQNKYNKEALSSVGSGSYHQSGNYKKQSSSSSSAQYGGYKDDVVNYKNIEEIKRIQRSNQQSAETFQRNQNILNNIDDVFGDSKKESQANAQHNMNILGNLDMDNILGNNDNNAGTLDFSKEGNAQQRVGNVGGGFMDFSMHTGNNNNTYVNNSGNTHQQINMNHNYNNNNNFQFDNNNHMNNFTMPPQPSNQIQSNYNNNNSSNNGNFQFENNMGNIINSNQNYLQNQQPSPMMPNPTNFISQPIQQPLSQDFNINPNPSSFQTINQPQPPLTSATSLTTDSEPNTLHQQQQLYSQLNDTNPTLSAVPSSTNSNLFQANAGQPQNDFKSKIMSTGLVNIDNLLGDSQMNPNYIYNFNTSSLSLSNPPSANAQPQSTSSPFDF